MWKSICQRGMSSQKRILAVQTTQLLSTLLEKSAPTIHNDVWSICNVMIRSFDKSAWESIDDKLWSKLLNSVKQMPDGDGKLKMLLNSKGDIKHVDTKSIDAYKNVVFFNAQDAQEWLKSDNPDLPTIYQVLKNHITMDHEVLYSVFGILRKVPNFHYGDFLSTLKNFNNLIDQSKGTRTAENISYHLENAEFPVAGILSSKGGNLLLYENRSLETNRYSAVRLKTCLFVMNMIKTIANEGHGLDIGFFNDFLRIIRPVTYQDALLYIQFMQSHSINPDIKTFSALVSYADISTAQKLMALCRSKGISAGSNLLVPFLNACEKHNNVVSASTMYFSFPLHIRRELYSDSHKNVHVDWLFQSLCRTESVEAAYDMSRDMLDCGYIPKYPSIKSLITELCSKRRPDLAVTVFWDFGVVDRDLNQMEIYSIVVSYAKINEFGPAIDFITELEDQNVHVSRAGKKRLMKEIIKARQFRRAQIWLNSAKFKDTHVVNLLLQAYFDNEMPSEVGSLYLDLLKWGLKPNQETFEVLIEGYLKIGTYEQAWELLEELKSANCYISNSVYSHFLNYLIVKNQWAKALEIWDDIKVSKFCDKSAMYMIRGYALLNDLEGVKKIQGLLDPEIHTDSFLSLVLVYLRSGNTDLANECAELCKNTKTRSFVLAEFIGFYARKGDFITAESYLNEYLTQFAPHPRAFSTIIRSAVKVGSGIQQAEKYWSQLCSTNIALDTSCYGSIIAAYSDAGSYGKALQKYTEFKKTKLPMSLNLAGTMLVLYGRLGKVRDLENLYREVTRPDGGLKPTMALMNALMSGYAFSNQWKKAYLLWKRLWIDQLSDPFQNTETFIDRDVASIPVTSQAALFFTNLGNEIIRSNFGVDPVTACIILDALGFANRPTELQLVWNELNIKKFPITLNMITSYVEALVRCGLHNEAFYIVMNIERLYSYTPDIKLLRNFYNLLPSSLKSEATLKIIYSYPQIKEIYLQEIEKIENLDFNGFKPLQNVEEGIDLKDFESKIAIKNGLLLLPALDNWE
ncbi:hypothetical protein BC833DRAFT_594173 [Globomyces pollinis-pini]|nr:hypothetical protein BC833DRAFT_594173 [Globomyces pollinis-pini]